MAEGDFGPQKIQNKLFLIHCSLLFPPSSFLPYHVLVHPKPTAFKAADFMFLVIGMCRGAGIIYKAEITEPAPCARWACVSRERGLSEKSVAKMD